jgi:hypothetical protein
LVLVVVSDETANPAQDAGTPGRRRPNRRARPAARRAAATTSGRRRLFRAAKPLQGEKAVFGVTCPEHIWSPSKNNVKWNNHN